MEVTNNLLEMIKEQSRLRWTTPLEETNIPKNKQESMDLLKNLTTRIKEVESIKLYTNQVTTRIVENNRSKTGLKFKLKCYKNTQEDNFKYLFI